MKNQKSQNKGNDGNFFEKLKEAWSNKSIRYVMIAFIVLVVFTVLKIVFKF